MKTIVSVVKQPISQMLEVRMGVVGADDKFMKVNPIVMAEAEPGAYMDPAFCLDMATGQVLMDELWGAGLRPTEGSGSAGSLAATERHLADMRHLVFDRLMPAKPAAEVNV